MAASTPLLDLPEGRVDPRHRDRLIGGLLASIEERGYPATTIADIVRHAHVSKRTFYKHFADKEEALRALYVFASENLQQRIAAASADEREWKLRCHAAVRGFAQGLAEYPGLARTILIELPATGPRSLSLRAEVHDRFAHTIADLAAQARAQHPALRPITPELATAITGAIHELMLRALQDGKIDPERVADTATELIAAVLTAPSQTAT
jgi:AcrR family transcriptional regulator